MSDSTVAISIVPADAFAWHRQLHAHHIVHFMDEMVDILVQSGVVITAIIGLDVSFNVLAARRKRDRWQLQVYVIATVSNEGMLRRYLKKKFPKSAAVSKPWRVRRFDGTAYAASYAFKYQFVRRASYRGRNGRWTTKKRRLLAREHIELMHVLADLGLEGRVRLISVDPHQLSGGV